MPFLWFFSNWIEKHSPEIFVPPCPFTLNNCESEAILYFDVCNQDLFPPFDTKGTLLIGGSRGYARDATTGPKFLHFQIGQTIGWRPLRDCRSIWEILGPPLLPIWNLAVCDVTFAIAECERTLRLSSGINTCLWFTPRSLQRPHLIIWTKLLKQKPAKSGNCSKGRS